MKIEPLDFSHTFKQTYHDYAEDVIKNRALPDLRDGLKPVHRAILTDMLSSKVTSDKSPVKVKKITGSVIANWHPHGDGAVEDALVRMAIPWQNSLPAIFIKGNKGSVYGDPHASGRYIETKLTPTGDAYGVNMTPGIVKFEPNFDETRQMPTVLPARLPYLLINGRDGIGVGFASSIPTHNPIEATNAFLAYVQNPKIKLEKLLEIMPRPDFYTKATIINQDDMLEMYKTRRGSIRVRATIEYNAKKNELKVVEMPASAAGSMDKLLEELVTATSETVDSKGKKKLPKIKGINSVNDFSGKAGVDITISLKRGVNHEQILQELYAKTSLESNVNYNFSALNDKRLKTYSLTNYFKEYLAFVHQTIQNEFRLERERLAKRQEILEGLLKLPSIIDEVVDLAKNSNGKKDLEDALSRPKILPGVLKKYEKKILKFDFTPLQAEYIARLQLYRLNKLDYKDFEKELAQNKKDLVTAKDLVESATKRKAVIKKRIKDELKKMDDKVFARKTKIINDQATTASQIEIPETNLYVAMDKYGYVRIEESSFPGSIKTTNKSRLRFFDEHGTCWNLHLENVKVTKGKRTLVNILLDIPDTIVGWTTKITAGKPSLGLFVFTDGHVKITDVTKYMTKSKARKTSKVKDLTLAYMADIPNKKTSVTINDDKLMIAKLSNQRPTGKGRLEIKPSEQMVVKW